MRVRCYSLLVNTCSSWLFLSETERFRSCLKLIPLQLLPVAAYLAVERILLLTRRRRLQVEVLSASQSQPGARRRPNQHQAVRDYLPAVTRNMTFFFKTSFQPTGPHLVGLLGEDCLDPH